MKIANNLQPIVVKLNRKAEIAFNGQRLANVVALNHDDSVRRRFSVYRTETGFVAQRVDNPDTIDVRYFGAECADVLAVYDFFGNEPLANYLYGSAGLAVPGLRTCTSPENT